MKRAKNLVVQGRLFGADGVVERFRVDEATGLVTRTVSRRDHLLEPVTTDVGHWKGDVPLDDLRSVADLSFLQRAERPETVIEGEEIRIADLFSGCGAMSLGVVEACRAVGKQALPVAAFDINPRIAEVYGRNFGLPDLQARDLSSILQFEVGVPPSDAERALIDELERVDFVVAGPPCQGHSNLNNKTRRIDPKNELYFLVARFAELFRPRWMVVENVSAVMHDQGQVVQRTHEALEALGYGISDGTVDLWTLGVAQTRKRHITVAQLRPEPSLAKEKRELPYLDDLLAPFYTKLRPMSWAVGDLLNVAGDNFMDKPREPDEITQARIEYLFDHDLYDLPKSQRPPSHKGQHGDSYKSVYGRMRWDEPAPTMTRGFFTMGQGRFVHPKRRRTVTAHEAARIQFIPDFFDFSSLHDNRSVLAETIGNAVPPKLSYVIALELLR